MTEKKFQRLADKQLASKRLTELASKIIKQQKIANNEISKLTDNEFAELTDKLCDYKEIGKKDIQEYINKIFKEQGVTEKAYDEFQQKILKGIEVVAHSFFVKMYVHTFTAMLLIFFFLLLNSSFSHKFMIYSWGIFAVFVVMLVQKMPILIFYSFFIFGIIWIPKNLEPILSFFVGFSTIFTLLMLGIFIINLTNRILLYTILIFMAIFVLIKVLNNHDEVLYMACFSLFLFIFYTLFKKLIIYYYYKEKLNIYNKITFTCIACIHFTFIILTIIIPPFLFG